MSAVHRDSAGLRLVDYPRPSVAVDTAVLSIDPERRLAVVQVRRPGGGAWWALPGTFLHEGERLVDAVRRSLRDKAGIEGLRPRQLHVFDDPRRDDRGWVVSVAHLDVVPAHRLAGILGERVRLAPAQRPGRLPYDHAEIVRIAAADLRARYAAAPDPGGLLPERFTLRALRSVHEAVAGCALQRDTFRRSMQAQLVATGESTSGHRGRPAELFTRAAGR